MTLTKDEQKLVREFLDRVFSDVEADLYYAIKTRHNMREELLSQLDVLTKIKERADARLD
jgi:hypothetical protein